MTSNITSRRENRATRRGVIVPLAALMMVFLLGMVAFAVDMAWIVLVQTELQSSADAAALAGAQPLIDGYVLYNLPKQTNRQSIADTAMANARAKAKEYAGYNKAGNSYLTLNDADIEFGYVDSTGTYTPNATPLTAFPNTIKVTLRRDNQANGSLPLFFARALGAASTNLTALARATIYAGKLNTIPAGILPVTYNQADWYNFLKTGLDPDGGFRKDANGNPELKVYPSVKDTGAFGWLSLDDSTVSASTLRGWIDNGASTNDIQTLVNNGLIPLSSHDSTKWDWQGKPGFTASGVMDVNTYIGKSFVLPLYKAYDAKNAGLGQGKNYFYDIVEFVGVRIDYTPDKNREIVIQPAPIIVPNALLDPNTIAPAGTSLSTSLSTTFGPPKLTQ